MRKIILHNIEFQLKDIKRISKYSQKDEMPKVLISEISEEEDFYNIQHNSTKNKKSLQIWLISVLGNVTGNYNFYEYKLFFVNSKKLKIR